MPEASPTPDVLTDRRCAVKESTNKPAASGPRGLGGYCWAEHQGGRHHCTLPVGHGGMHWHAYSKTSW